MKFDELIALRNVTTIKSWTPQVQKRRPYYKGMDNRELCYHAEQMNKPTPFVTGVIEFYQKRHFLSFKQRTLLIHLLLKDTT